MSNSELRLQPDVAEGTLSVQSHAKVNLFFRILARRPDGFHDIASLYHTIDLHDRVHVKLNEMMVIECDHPDVPLDQSNLVAKALQFFDCSAKVKIEKRIPIGAGLGGGSSNAAAVLWAMNQLLDHPYTYTELLQNASKIGSDVPFFLSHGFSYCTGRGEVLQNTSAIPLKEIWIKTPPIHCATPKVYEACQPNEASEVNPRTLLRAFERGEPQFVNDLQPAALRVYPELKKWLKEAYELGFEQVMLTGSGSSIVGFNPASESLVEKMGYLRAKLTKTQLGKSHGRE